MPSSTKGEFLSSSEPHTFRDHFLPNDFHKFWPSMMIVCLFTEVKQQWAVMSDGFSTLLVSPMALLLDLDYQNPF